jgi:hypothetical protein
MSNNWLLALQSFLQFLQTVNVGLAVFGPRISPIVPLLITALISAISSFVQHAGNQTIPTPVADQSQSQLDHVTAVVDHAVAAAQASAPLNIPIPVPPLEDERLAFNASIERQIAALQAQKKGS